MGYPEVCITPLPLFDVLLTNPACSYWHQRYQLFSKYDDGVLLTDDAWFGVTPEAVAKLVSRLPQYDGI